MAARAPSNFEGRNSIKYLTRMNRILKKGIRAQRNYVPRKYSEMGWKKPRK
jgi:hypothetical protein